MTESNRQLFTEDTGKRDAGWVADALAGDADCFGQLVEAYQKSAFSVAYRLLNNRDDAMEVVQEALLRAFRSLARLKEPSRFGPWLMRIVSNLSLNYRRSRQSRSAETLDEQWADEQVTTARGDRVVTSLAPGQRAEDQEAQEALDAALNTLPDKQRIALVLFAIEGWAQKDIAELLECSLENVKWNVFQARKRLRERLGEVISR